MKPSKIIIAIALLNAATLAHAEATWADLPRVFVQILGYGFYYYAWLFAYIALCIATVFYLLRLILSGLGLINDASSESWLKVTLGNIIASSMLAFAVCFVVVAIGFGFGLKPLSWAEASKVLETNKPAGAVVEHKSRKQIKAELDAIPKVKDDLSWQKYSPLKRPWPEYEGALYKVAKPLDAAPYSVEIFIGGLPRKSKLIKLCSLDNAGACNGQVAYMLNTTNYVFNQLFKGQYVLHILNLQTGQALESAPINLDDKWKPRKHFDLTNIDLNHSDFYKEISLDKF